MKVQTPGIDHLHLNVYDLDAAIQLFTQLFRCKHNIPLYIDSVDGMNSMNSLGIDVISPASEEGFFGSMMKKTGGEGISAVAFYVDDLDAATAHIRETGIRVISEIGYPDIERQTQFHPRDLFGMSLELVYLYPGAKAKMAAIQLGQAEQNGGRPHIEAEAEAVFSGGIHHVRMRVESEEHLRTAVGQFESWFEGDWIIAADGRSAISSLDLHVVVEEGAREGVDAFAMAVPELQKAVRRAEAIGLRKIGTPDYLAATENAVCFAPESCFGLSLILVESELEREHRHH
jgi:methylmalonyl-CoA/ethylmalonyl-CoA epimerase